MSSNIASNRVNNIMGHISSNPTSSNSSSSSDQDIVIVSALRTPICKARRGGLKDAYVEELLSTVIKATLESTKVDPASLGDIIVGTVLGQGSQRANECRIASFLAGVPYSVPIHTINRQCSSGLQAIAHVGANIRMGYYDIGLACGVESMSSAAFNWEGSLNPKVFLNQQAKDCLLPMGITSENVAKEYDITREAQDQFAVRSNLRADAARKAGKFKKQIVPVKTKFKDPKTGQVKDIVVADDDGIRGETTIESLKGLKPAFDPKGTTTAGNASQVSDGAAAVLVTSRGYAKKHNLPILAVFENFAVSGVPPKVMGIGPAYAIPDVLKKANLSTNDIDVYEINEAFASQALYCVKKLGLDENKVNPNGGAIALGHPLGCSGARMVADIIAELQRTNGNRGIVSMCIGSGMGAAGIIKLEK